MVTQTEASAILRDLEKKVTTSVGVNLAKRMLKTILVLWHELGLKEG